MEPGDTSNNSGREGHLAVSHHGGIIGSNKGLDGGVGRSRKSSVVKQGTRGTPVVRVIITNMVVVILVANSSSCLVGLQ